MLHLHFYAGPTTKVWMSITQFHYLHLLSMMEAHPDFCEGSALLQIDIEPDSAQSIDLTQIPPAAFS